MLRTVSLVAVASLFGAGVAIAQTTTPSNPPATNQAPAEKVAPPASDSATTMTNDGLKLTEEQASNWIDKSVVASDGESIGEVSAIKRDADGKVVELHADIGGFLGLGETRVKVMPSQFKFEGDRVVLSMTSEEAKALPKIPQ